MGKGEQKGAEMTIEELMETEPQLVEQIEKSGADKLAAEIANAPIDKLAEKFPAIVNAIAKKVEAAMQTRPANLKIDGFLLERSDPFAEPAARCFAVEAKIEVQQLPMVLPYANKEATVAALRNYYQRANGAGDTKRAKASADALAKLGVDIRKKQR
jgi:hypothetical protein